MELVNANEFIQPGNGYSAKYALSMLSSGGGSGLKKNKGSYKKVSEMYSDLAIPAGLYVKPEFVSESENHVTSESKEVFPEDLYSKLVSLASPLNKKKKMTRRKKVEKKKGKKKTKRVTFNL
jgi:hypothetical protein